MGLIQDLRHAVRTLMRAPAFATASILTLAIGIGANTAIYSLARALIFKPVAISDPDRVVQINEIQPGSATVPRHAAHAGIRNPDGAWRGLGQGVGHGDAPRRWRSVSCWASPAPPC